MVEGQSGFWCPAQIVRELIVACHAVLFGVRWPAGDTDDVFLEGEGFGAGLFSLRLVAHMKKRLAGVWISSMFDLDGGETFEHRVQAVSFAVQGIALESVLKVACALADGK